MDDRPVLVTYVYDADLQHKEQLLDRIWRALVQSRNTQEVRVLFLDRVKPRDE